MHDRRSDPPQSRPRLLDEVAAVLREVVSTHQEPALPSMAVLAGQLGVCRTTLWRAAASLRSEGLLSFSGGSRIRITGRVRAYPGARTDAAERLCSLAVERMRDGTWPCGEPLPKIGYLAATDHLSPRTVGEAWNRLVARGLAHRRGKRFIAGSAPPAGRRSSAPVILVLTRTIETWEWMCTRAVSQEFARTFTEQAVRNSVRLSPGVIDPVRSEGSVNFVTGLDRTIRYVRRLGDRYLGALVAVVEREAPVVGDYLRELGRIGRPVVWFDRSGSASTVVDRKYHGVIRCRTDENRMVDAALAHLAGLGHRAVAYPYQGRHAWMVYRLDTLSAAASRLPGAPRVFGFGAHSSSRRRDPGFVVQQVAALRKWGVPAVLGCLAYFGATRARWTKLCGAALPPEMPKDKEEAGLLAFAVARSAGGVDKDLHLDHNRAADCIWASIDLLPCLLSGATAWISPNDVAAGHHLAWLRMAGVDVPGQISLISFDNAHRYGFHRLTSVDPGYSLLGYRAFHAIRQSLPVESRRDRELCAEPVVTDKGSTGVVAGSKA